MCKVFKFEYSNQEIFIKKAEYENFHKPPYNVDLCIGIFPRTKSDLSKNG